MKGLGLHIVLLALIITYTSKHALCIDALYTSKYVSSLIDSAAIARDNKEFAKALNYSLLALNSSGNNDSAKYHSHKTVSTVLWELGAARDAIDHLHFAIGINRKKNISGEFDNSIILGTIGSYHLATNQIDSAIYVFKNAIDILTELNNPLFLASANNNLGLAYAKSKKYKLALKAYEQAFTTIDYDDVNHLRFCAVINSNMANIFIKQSEFEKAKGLLIESIKLMDSNGLGG